MREDSSINLNILVNRSIVTRLWTMYVHKKAHIFDHSTENYCSTVFQWQFFQEIFLGVYPLSWSYTNPPWEGHTHTHTHSLSLGLCKDVLLLKAGDPICKQFQSSWILAWMKNILWWSYVWNLRNVRWKTFKLEMKNWTRFSLLLNGSAFPSAIYSSIATSMLHRLTS